MIISEHSFLATEEKGEVSAILMRPDDAEYLLVLGHGAGADMRHANMEAIAIAMSEAKIATLRYNFSFKEYGKGRESQKTSVATVEAAIGFAGELVTDLPLLAGGHSYGGRMTSWAAAEGKIDSVTGLIYFSFPLHAPGKPSKDRANHLKDIKQTMLFLSGDRDTLANTTLLKEVLEELSTKASIHWLETANHGYKTLKRTRINPLTIFQEMSAAVNHWKNHTLSH